MAGSVGRFGHVPGMPPGRRTKNPVNSPHTFGGTSRVRVTPVPPVVEIITVSDSARISGVSLHIATSDVIAVVDAPTISAFIAPQPSLYKLMPGIGSRAHRRARGPANAPRFFKKSSPRPPPSYSFAGADTIPISDVAARSAVPSRVSASDAIAVSDVARTPEVAHDSLALSDAARLSGTGLHAADSIAVADSLSRSPQSYAAHASDAVSVSDAARGTRGHTATNAADGFSISDAARGPTGHNLATASDHIVVADVGRPGSEIIVITDSAAAGPVFFGGADSITITDTGAGLASAIRAFVYQSAVEVATSPSATASIFQVAVEVATTLPCAGQIYQTGVEVVVAATHPGGGQPDLWWLWRRRHYRR